jgi:hypothetical protein
MRSLREAYGPTSTDRRHVFHAYGTYDLPFGKGKTFLRNGRLVDALAGGWTVGTIFQYSSGAPFQLSGGNQTYNNLMDGGIVLKPGVTVKDLQNAIGVYPGPSGTTRYWINPKFINLNTGQANSTYLSPNTTPGTVGILPWLYNLPYYQPDISIVCVRANHG